jgi:hypothetical protein
MKSRATGSASPRERASADVTNAQRDAKRSRRSPFDPKANRLGGLLAVRGGVLRDAPNAFRNLIGDALNPAPDLTREMFNKARDVAFQIGKIAADRGQVRICIVGGAHGQSLETSQSNRDRCNDRDTLATVTKLCRLGQARNLLRRRRSKGACCVTLDPCSIVISRKM